MTLPIPDAFGRPLSSLRLSVTDRCNLRCSYCMPEEEYRWLAREHILRFEELAQLVDVFITLGVTKLRLTGGEPLLRRDLPSLVAMLAAKAPIRDLALTTNGILLEGYAADLRRAGLQRLTVSLDTLQPDRFLAMTRRTGLDRVLAGLAAAATAGFRKLKLDTVVMRGVNDDEIVPLVEYAKSLDAEIRFIEYMDVGGATRWSMDQVVTRAQILEHIEAAYGPVHGLHEESSAPAERFMLADGTVFGIIASTTAPFCRTCDRSRLTADGLWYTCLYATHGTDLRGALRRGDSPEAIAELVAQTWRVRTDRGAEERLARDRREPLVQITDLRADPHLEMHTRGG